MQYCEFHPSPDLAPYIQCFWTLEDSFSSDTSIDLQRQRILPDGCLEVIFHYGDHFRQFLGEDHAVVQPRCFVFGPLSSFIEIGPAGRFCGIIAVRFAAHGAGSFLPIPLAELTNRSVALDDVWGKEGRKLASRVLEAADNSSRITLLEHFFRTLLKGRVNQDLLVRECVRRIMVSGGLHRVNTVLRGLDVSTRQLERRFMKAVGFSPKRLTRIARFQNACRHLQDNRMQNLTVIAHECGYYDQAHFIRDFKEHAGITPSRFRLESHQLYDLLISTEESR